jgi:L-fuconolactonase
LLDFAELYPELRLVVDHGAKPQIRSGDIAEWRHEMQAVARGTNAVCKLSGLVTEAGSANPAQLAPAVDHLLEVFGPDRLMWGSDWPVCELVCSYDEWYQASEMLLVRLDALAREADLFRNRTSHLWNLSDLPARPRSSRRPDRASGAPAPKPSCARAPACSRSTSMPSR